MVDYVDLFCALYIPFEFSDSTTLRHQPVRLRFKGHANKCFKNII